MDGAERGLEASQEAMSQESAVVGDYPAAPASALPQLTPAQARGIGDSSQSML